jgi:hypothetical protein
MIKKFVDILKGDYGILDYINSSSHIDGVNIGARNIGDLQHGEHTIEDDNLIVTVIRIEEESALKNFPNQQIVQSNGAYKVDKRNPKIYLNYYLLFSSTMQYDKGVATIDRVIKFFQKHKKIAFEADGDKIALNMELCSMTFEQLNNIWGMYGGKQLPNVIYKARVNSLEKDEQVLVPVVESTSTNISQYE